jgi:hypothetical protein
VKFLGIDIAAQDRIDQNITGTEGDWPNLTVGAVGTVNWVEQDDQGRNNPRLFVDFDITCPSDDLSALLGLPSGWPVLTTEVEKVDVEAAA